MKRSSVTPVLGIILGAVAVVLAVILLITFIVAHYRGKMDALRKELAAGS